MKTTSYAVKPVIRYMVTESTDEPERGRGSHAVIGVFDNEQTAEEVMKALAEVHLGLMARCAKSAK